MFAQRSISGWLQAVQRDWRAAQLGLSWVAISVVVALMVLVPYVLYLRGRAIRNRLTFEVGAMELAVERASRAMAERERALRAFLYRPDERRLHDHASAAIALRAALDSVEAIAATDDAAWRRDVARLRALEGAWEHASRDLVERAARGERDLLDDPDTARPGPVYAEFQAVAATLLGALDAEKRSLVAAMSGADDARLAMPFALALLGLPILVYVGRLSVDVIRLLAIARAEQERLARVLEHMVDPVLVTDRRGTITLANPAARSLLGAHDGAPVSALADRLRDSERGTAILSAIAGAEPLAAAEVEITSGTEERWVSVSSAPIAVRRDVVGAVTVLRDLSDRVRYEQERLKTERFHALGAMAERLAHDFGNYLEAASGAAAMLERPSAADPAKRSRWVRLIRTTIDEGRNVLAGLRTLSFISYRSPRFTSVELHGVVSRALDVARLARPDAGAIELSDEVPPGLRVPASESDLVRALVNVLVNAIDATASGGRVDVAARVEDGNVRLAIRDTGVGIPPEDHERIFDMYFTTKGARGSGMGLALAREVVHLHGGDILLESAPGAGSTFTVVLPLAHDEASTSPRTHEGAALEEARS
ncbi:two-component system sensor histidine kinase NtrB [Sandaracinus amylolyticus]|uniref:histidine kinase n=1 Tax=Sandaracinus amylolyticus TaxID=927083 RepID=A0A0F6W8H8_9BACT|nr:ATP-binding protein [Sandaracinus amylolyticus]AKF10187.1 Flagellar sensor histidine kinase FleS [Sandaracinus amylolyticus]